MDGQEPTGAASEFLAMRADMLAEAGETPEPTESAAPPAPAPVSSQEPDSQPAAADPAPVDTSPEERVAAALGLGAEEPAEVAAADADDEDEDEETDTPSLDGMTPEEIRALAEEWLTKRAELAEQSVDAEQEALNREVYSLDAQTENEVNARYRQGFQEQVIAPANAHYAALLAQKLDEVNSDEERLRVIQVITDAQRAYEARKAAEWQPHIDKAVDEAQTAARKQHPGLRKLFAELLVEERGLPKKAIDELLKVTNTDDMPVVADSLKTSVAAHRKQKQQTQQATREAAARATPALHSPSTTTPAPRQVAELTGSPEEFLAMRRYLAQ